MLNKPSDLINLEIESSFSRRSFLARSLTGGLALSLPVTVSGQSISTEMSFELCSRPSTINSLGFYSDLVDQLLTEILADKFVTVSVALDRCTKAFEELFNKVKELEQELSDSGMKAQAQQIRDLSEIGRDQTRLITSSLTSANELMAPMLASLTVVSTQLSAQTQNLTLQTEIKISPRAAKLIKSIIQLANSEEFKSLANDIKRSRGNMASQAVAFVELSNDIRTNIDEARQKMVDVENPFWTIEEKSKKRAASIRDREVARQSALTELVTAVARLKDLILNHKVTTQLNADLLAQLPLLKTDGKEVVVMPGALFTRLEQVPTQTTRDIRPEDLIALAKGKEEMQAIDSLILALLGAYVSIKHPPVESKITLDRRDEDVKFVEAVSRTAQQNPCTIRRPTVGQRISCMLWQNCPPGTAPETALCESLYVDFRNFWYSIPLPTLLAAPFLVRHIRKVISKGRDKKKLCIGTPANLENLVSGFVTLVIRG